MYFKPFIFTTLTICCLAFLTAQAANTARVSHSAASAEAIEVGVTAKAITVNANTAQVTDVPESQSLWLYRNEFNNTSGFAVIRFLANDDTLAMGGKTCEMIDDFEVPHDSSWSIDTVKVYLFWNGQNADSYILNIFKDDGFGFPMEPAAHSLTFTANLTQEMALYQLNINTSTEDIELGPGFWWVGLIGVYNNLKMPDDTARVYWNRKDTLLATYAALARDSIGAAYVQYPTPWLILNGGPPERPENSFRFWIRGTSSATAIKMPRYKVGSRLAIYPNPAADFITFSLDNARGKQIEMYDVMGKLVNRISLKKGVNKVPVKDFQNGVYTYRLLGEAGKLIEHGRFTVSR